MLNKEKVVYKVSVISILVNIVLFLFKFIVGFLANSSAMISDAIHSLSDILSTIIVMIGTKLSFKEADKEHPYGHEKIECLAALILAVILFITGLSIGYNGIISIVNKTRTIVPGILALTAAITSIIVKEVMYWYTRYYAKKIDSNALMADAWHHRSDALSSVGSFIGIFISRLGFTFFDSLASVIICIFIIKTSIDIFSDSMNRLVDRACDSEVESQIKQVILINNEVQKVDSIKTRLFGNKAYVDVEIQLDGNKYLKEAHEIAEQIHDAVEKEFPFIKHCMIHINPTIYKK